jgi:hypothetical protein
MPASAANNPMREAASRPPRRDRLSSNTVIPNTMLPNNVTALLEPIAGARPPVVSADR